MRYGSGSYDNITEISNGTLMIIAPNGCNVIIMIPQNYAVKLEILASKSTSLSSATTYNKITSSNYLNTTNNYQQIMTNLFAFLTNQIPTIPVANVNSVQKMYETSGISAYSTSTSYVVGDYVYNYLTLYKCNTATSGSFDSSKWTQKTYLDYLRDSLNS